ncbi:hypothetical protein GLOIN_2v1792321 [Rhizophagus clarus]|uniref:Uncharacterized protein n=1 Tax=Rhizophagus clarus TaxID=94130 RepID=A0A8H3M1U9_9GLOM|nr:hypothetical protein GLOIN_2v1792321 [Rhizophagus clarus]
MQILLAEKYWSVYHMHCLYAGFGKGKDNECSKAETKDGSAQLIQRAYRNYRKRFVSLEKQVWKAVRNDNTPREKKFLSMPSRDIYCTVNLNICKYTKPKNITSIKPVEIKDFMLSLISKFWNESCSLTPPLLPLKPFALMQCSASAPKISAYRFERSQVLIDAGKYFDSVRKNAKKEIDLISLN